MRLEPSMDGKRHENTRVYFTNEIETHRKMRRIATDVCFTQMSARKGIEKHGKVAIAAMIKEYKQLNELAVPGAVHPNAIDDGEKRKALRAINLIKEKRRGKIKGRTVADGSQQRKYVSRDETTSLTISLQALFATFIVDVQEGRKAQTFDVPGAYLHAEIPKDEKIYMKFEGDFEVNHEYRKNV